MNHVPRWTKILYIPLIVVMVLMLTLVSAIGAAADSGSATYHLLLGVPPVEGPDVAMASDGSTVSITGQGDLSIPPKSVSGSGSFTIRDSSGTITANGTWTATGLLSFVPYGCGVLMGSPVPPNFCGGEALISVHLSTGPDAVLFMTCLAGNPPPARDEGIRLAVQGGPNFNKQVSGQTLFILQ